MFVWKSKNEFEISSTIVYWIFLYVGSLKIWNLILIRENSNNFLKIRKSTLKFECGNFSLLREIMKFDDEISILKWLWTRVRRVWKSKFKFWRSKLKFIDKNYNYVDDFKCNFSQLPDLFNCHTSLFLNFRIKFNRR